MAISPNHNVELQELYNTPAVNHLSGFRDFARLLKPAALISAYQRLVTEAPRRHMNDKKYFVGHTGRPSGGGKSNRREERLAIALWNWNREHGPFQLSSGHYLNLLDYQLPLFTQRSGEGIKAVDLFAVRDNQQPCVVELKIHPEGKGQSDTPLRAFLEALAYCAVLEANIAAIAAEAAGMRAIEIQPVRPSLVILAPDKYWYGYLNHPSAGDWWPVIKQIATQLREKMNLESHFLVLRDSRSHMGLDGEKPHMTGNPRITYLEDLTNRTY